MPVVYNVKELVAATGLSRSKIYEEMKAGRLSARKVGRRTIFLDGEVQNYLASLPIAGATSINDPLP